MAASESVSANNNIRVVNMAIDAGLAEIDLKKNPTQQHCPGGYLQIDTHTHTHCTIRTTVLSH